jgi:hypothetical protein
VNRTTTGSRPSPSRTDVSALRVRGEQCTGADARQHCELREISPAAETEGAADHAILVEPN